MTVANKSARTNKIQLNKGLELIEKHDSLREKEID
jgi:hypothetical protein